MAEQNNNKPKGKSVGIQPGEIVIISISASFTVLLLVMFSQLFI